MLTYPYFRVTKYNRDITPEDLEVWLEHFEERGIPAAIIKHSNPRNGHTLWRMGHESAEQPNREEMLGVVVKSVHGFGFKSVDYEGTIIEVGGRRYVVDKVDKQPS